MHHMQHWFAWWPTLIVVAVATFTDLSSRRIPNWLVLPFLLAGIIVSPFRADWSGVGRGILLRTDWTGIRHDFWHSLGQSFAGLGLGFLIFGMVMCWAVLGGFIKELFTGVGDLIFSWKRRGLHPDPEQTLANPLKRKMPYAPAIAIGTLMSFFAP